MGDRTRLWTLLRSLIENAPFPGPVAELELELGGLTAESGRQQGLFVDRQRKQAELDEMVRHLKVRYGHSVITSYSIHYTKLYDIFTLNIRIVFDSFI